MQEKDLGKALLRGEHPVDVSELTRNLLKRDRWRIWITGILCVIAWIFVVLLPWSTLLPGLARFKQLVLTAQNPAPGSTLTAEQLAQTLQLALIVKTAMLSMFMGSIALLVAVACTMLLITVSRRATLRQVNARLGEISDQLKLLAAKQG
jgi:ABC-type Fe3+ transport system permease subunit